MDVRPAATTPPRLDQKRRPIVVGASPDGRSASAVVWAVLEAESTGREVRLVTATHATGEAEPDQSGHDLSVLARRLTLGRVASHRTVGPVVPALLEAAADAELVVVGHRNRPRLKQAMAGGTCVTLAALSPVPVVMVPEAWIQPRFAAAPLVLGLSPEAGKGAEDPWASAIAFAFGRADSMQVPLTVVCAWQVSPVMAFDAAAIRLYEQGVRSSLQTRLEPWLAHFPGVEVTLDCSEATPVDVLVEASRHAQLTVVGRARHGDRGCGSIVRGLLHRALSPVAVVPRAPIRH